jgi:hypothetical protein
MPATIDSPAYRALKVATAAMGVLIVAGTVTLAALVVGRLSGPGGSGPARLVEPAGSRIAGIAAADGRLLVQVTGGGLPDRVRVFSLRDLPAGGVEIVHQ